MNNVVSIIIIMSILTDLQGFCSLFYKKMKFLIGLILLTIFVLPDTMY